MDCFFIQLRPVDIITSQSHESGVDLQEDDILIDTFVINYGTYLYLSSQHQTNNNKKTHS
jgi:hypothetical protein